MTDISPIVATTDDTRRSKGIILFGVTAYNIS